MNRLKTLLLCLGSFWVIYSMSLLRIRLVNVPYPTILFHLNRIELNASQPFRKIDQLARQLVTPPTSKRPQLRLKNTANFFGYTAQVCFRGCMMCAMAVGEVYWMKTSKTCLDDARLVFSLPQRRVRSHRSCGDVSSITVSKGRRRNVCLRAPHTWGCLRPSQTETGYSRVVISSLDDLLWFC